MGYKMTKPLYKIRQFRDFRELIDLGVEWHADRYAFEIKRENGEHYSITYREYREDIYALGAALFDLGCDGKRVAVAGDNCYEWCLSFMSVVVGGNVVVPIDKELGAEDINGIIRKSDAKVLFCDEKILQKLGGILPDDMLFICFKQKEDKDNVLSFDRLMEKGRKLAADGYTAYKDAKIDPEAMCTLLFTSGTTGASKGVMLSQRNFCQDVIHTLEMCYIDPTDCSLAMLPMHHTYENNIVLMCTPYCGSKVTFCEGFKYAMQNMKEFNPTLFIGVPLMLEMFHRRILKAIKAKPHGELKFKIGKAICFAASKVGINLKNIIFKEVREVFGGRLRMVIVGGAPMDPQVLKDFDAFGVQILYGYGLTECAPMAIMNHDRLHLAESIGVPIPSVEAKIDNPNEQGVGEICVRGPMVMLGYYENEEATRAVIDEDGFFHTGDLGRVDKRNRYYICGRSKNVIVTDNGKNIFPEELEYHLGRYATVGDSLVYGGTNAKGKLAVMAKILPNYDEIKEHLGKKNVTDEEVYAVISDVVDKVNQVVPKFKRITEFSIRKTPFIRNTSAKILRYREENLADGA